MKHLNFFLGQTFPHPSKKCPNKRLLKTILISALFSGTALFSFPPAATAADSSCECLSGNQEIKRPTFEFDPDNLVYPNEVPAYKGAHQEAYDYIDQELGAHIEALQRWLRQPSISAQNVGVKEMAMMLRDDLTELGFREAELVETDGHPGVWGFYDAGAPKTLLIYMMYDVQPVNPEDWVSPPFDATIIDHELGKAIMARGAVNQKGPQRAFLNAVEAIIKTTGTLPVNLMVVAEGEEELGSTHYPQIVGQYENRMKTADAVLFPAAGQGPGGDLSMILGVKGILYFELEARGGTWGGPKSAEIHGSLKAIVDSPTVRLVKAISSLTSEDGNTVLVPGFYDGIQPPTPSESALINTAALSRDDDQIRQIFGVDRWVDDLEGRAAILESLYIPTLNIDGIWSGYTGEGVKTILPHIATAKMDSRLPLGQDPDEIYNLIRQYLDDLGYGDLVMRKLSSYPAAQTEYKSDAVQAAIETANKYVSNVSIQPRTTGSAPFYQFTDRLGLPMVPFGLGLGSGAHAPNEYLIIEPKEGIGAAGLADIEKSYVDLLFALAEK